jgi:hypothetical protein
MEALGQGFRPVVRAERQWIVTNLQGLVLNFPLLERAIGFNLVPVQIKSEEFWLGDGEVDGRHR